MGNVAGMGIDDAAVCIPWRMAPDRIAAFERVMSFWKHVGAQVICADSTARRPFSLSQARNRAVRKAKARKVIVADADSLPDIGAVLAALDMEGVVYPFEEYRHIPGESVTMADLTESPVIKQYSASCGGIMVCDRELYWELGGFDERFEPRWGYEDNAFLSVARTLSTVSRVPGVVYSFDHKADRDMTEGNPNRARAELYRLCEGRPTLMRELLKR